MTRLIVLVCLVLAGCNKPPEPPPAVTPFVGVTDQYKKWNMTYQFVDQRSNSSTPLRRFQFYVESTFQVTPEGTIVVRTYANTDALKKAQCGVEKIWDSVEGCDRKKGYRIGVDANNIERGHTVIEINCKLRSQRTMYVMNGSTYIDYTKNADYPISWSIIQDLLGTT